MIISNGRRSNPSPVADRGERMKHLSIDLETYSSVDIGKTGVYRYC